MSRMARIKEKTGFTLLELMIAIFILALAVTILLGTESTSMRMMGYANNTSVVTMLTRAKMQDIEYEVQHQVKEEGVEEDYSDTMSGDFGDQGYDDIKWEALIQSIELSDDAANSFVESVTNQLYGTGDEGGTLSGNTTITQFLPLMVSFMPTIINQLGQRIRKITLTTSWDYLGVEQTLTVSEFVVILEVDAASGASGASVSGNTNANGETIDTGAIDIGNNTGRRTGSDGNTAGRGGNAGGSGRNGNAGGRGGDSGGRNGNTGGRNRN